MIKASNCSEFVSLTAAHKTNKSREEMLVHIPAEKPALNNTYHGGLLNKNILSTKRAVNFNANPNVSKSE